MPSYKTQFGTYLKTEDLAGRAHRVVIERMTIEDVGGEGKREPKIVAHFVGKPKALVMNKTKCEALEKLTGTDDYSQWPGTMIVLRPGVTKYAGKTVGCIDIIGQASAPQPQPQPQPQPVRRPQPVAPPPPPPEPEPEPDALGGGAFEDIDAEPENLDDIPF